MAQLLTETQSSRLILPLCLCPTLCLTGRLYRFHRIPKTPASHTGPHWHTGIWNHSTVALFLHRVAVSS